MIEAALRQKFLDLIQSQTGIRLRSQDWVTLSDNIMHRIQFINVESPQAYYQHLTSGLKSFAESESEAKREWDYFLELVTIGESYFFRDHGQFQVLREHILPDLIAQQRQAYTAGSIPQPTLNLWSAGCSSGEEPYSLAILLQELIPDLPRWQISILGTDLNPAALNKARQGLYRNWSFRQTEPQLKSLYFRPVSANWQIHDHIRERVTFRRGNLLADPVPNNLLSSMHLIICRNMFIYFEADAIATILRKLHSALNPKGYLITGHAELYNQNLQQFQVLSFSGSMAYRPQSVATAEPRSKPLSRSVETSPSSTLQPKAPLAIQYEVTSNSTTDRAAQHLLAQSHWQRGNLEQAMNCCLAALLVDGESLSSLYLMAQIVQKRGDYKQAKTILKKILYLQPTHIPAYFELGAIYAQDTQRNRATKMYHTAQELLEKLPPKTWIEYRGQVTAGELLMQLRQCLLQAS
ncbi:Chemotaxis protein methyltransferase [Acaryochloris thomasi RCC1774]|uniref:protein-glutamate O-methyltransferase n=1 Tax=Acaryochloris thomasi RCC1774 TaxID=1764569 RepID=A0A2W1J8R7_9CYAN|nr:protein-glutamate O-methyltransferase CheR [Acaryochloris thomasi]PZD70538.1 Chemotaxis protein methyltransferase [Acaryochloris thomasi RCC1774]